MSLSGSKDLRLITDAPVPRPDPDGILIRVTAAGVNCADMLIHSAPQIFGDVMGELFALIAAGVLTPDPPTMYELGDRPRALAELKSRSTIGKVALVP